MNNYYETHINEDIFLSVNNTYENTSKLIHNSSSCERKIDRPFSLYRVLYILSFCKYSNSIIVSSA